MIDHKNENKIAFLNTTFEGAIWDQPATDNPALIAEVAVINHAAPAAMDDLRLCVIDRCHFLAPNGAFHDDETRDAFDDWQLSLNGVAFTAGCYITILTYLTAKQIYQSYLAAFYRGASDYTEELLCSWEAEHRAAIVNEDGKRAAHICERARRGDYGEVDYERLAECDRENANFLAFGKGAG